MEAVPTPVHDGCLSQQATQSTRCARHLQHSPTRRLDLAPSKHSTGDSSFVVCERYQNILECPSRVVEEGAHHLRAGDGAQSSAAEHADAGASQQRCLLVEASPLGPAHGAGRDRGRCPPQLLAHSAQGTITQCLHCLMLAQDMCGKLMHLEWWPAHGCGYPGSAIPAFGIAWSAW